MTASLSSLGLDAARALEPSRYLMSGAAPRVAVRPVSRDEAVEALRAATRDALGVVPWGGGVALPHETAPGGYDVVLDLTGLDAIVEYEPDDLTLTAECGVSIHALREALAARGQELPLEAALASRATLGGALAANASGPRRRWFGAPRDRILGARYLLGDGTLARSGGKVVKNVAGYGIHRLLCGSRGGLAIILEASLKLQPAPARRVALIYGVDAATLADRERWSPFARLEPAALTVMSAALAVEAGLDPRGASHVAAVGLEGEELWVAEQERAVVHALGAAASRLEEAGVVTLWDALADLEERRGPRLSFTTADATPATLGANVLGTPFLFHALAGRLHLWPVGADGSGLVAALHESRMSLLEARGVGAIAPALPPQAAVRAMREELRRAIDPGDRFALGKAWLGDSAPAR